LPAITLTNFKPAPIGQQQRLMLMIQQTVQKPCTGSHIDRHIIHTTYFGVSKQMFGLSTFQ